MDQINKFARFKRKEVYLFLLRRTYPFAFFIPSLNTGEKNNPVKYR